MAGMFDFLGNQNISPGLAMWTSAAGVANFEGGGIFGHTSTVLGEVTTMAFEPTSKVC